MSARSTRLRLAAEHCPHALDLMDAGVPYERDVFAAGIAAHAVLEGLLRAARSGSPFDADHVADVVCTNLVTKGRSFDGVPEPPLKPEPVARGRGLALRYWTRPFLDGVSVPREWLPEHPLAVDRDWRPVPYSDAAYYRGILDTVGTMELPALDEWDRGGTGLVHTDYKSAPNTSAAELETIQLRGQSLLVLANARSLGVPEPAFIRRRVVNLFTGAEYETDLWLGDDLADVTLDTWRRDIALAVAHADARDGQKRIAAPGANCGGCPFVLRCEPARSYWQGIDLSPETAAQTYAVVDAARTALGAIVRGVVGRESVPVPGGTVGYVATEERTATATAASDLAVAWFAPDDPAAWLAENERVVSLLAAMKPTAANIGNVATVVHPGRGVRKRDGWKESRAAFLAGLLTVKRGTTFKVIRTTPIDDNDNDTATEDPA